MLVISWGNTGIPGFRWRISRKSQTLVSTSCAYRSDVRRHLARLCSLRATLTILQTGHTRSLTAILISKVQLLMSTRPSNGHGRPGWRFGSICTAHPRVRTGMITRAIWPRCQAGRKGTQSSRRSWCLSRSATSTRRLRTRTLLLALSCWTSLSPLCCRAWISWSSSTGMASVKSDLSAIHRSCSTTRSSRAAPGTDFWHPRTITRNTVCIESSRWDFLEDHGLTNCSYNRSPRVPSLFQRRSRNATLGKFPLHISKSVELVR